MADVVTTIRVDAQTRDALVEIAKLDSAAGQLARTILAAEMNSVSRFSRAADLLGKRYLPSMGSAFGAATSQVLSMTTGLQGASGMLSVIGQTALTLSPVLGGVAAAGAVVAAVMLKKKQQTAEMNEVLKTNREKLEDVAKANVELSGKAKELIAIRDAAVRQQLKEIELQITLAQVFKRQATFWDNVILGLKGGWAAAKQAQEQGFGLVNIGMDEQTKLLAELIAKWKDLNTEVGKFPDVSKGTPHKLGDQIGETGLMTTIEEIEKRQASLLSGAEFGPAGPMGTEQSRTAIAALQSQYDERFRITLEANNKIDQLNQAYADLGLQRDAQYSALVVAIKKDEAKKLNDITNQRFRVERAVQSVALSALGGSMRGHLQNILLMKHTSAREILQTTIDQVRGELAAHATMWAAEAIAYAFTPGKQAEAAAKAKAAAMAGVGAIALSGIATAFDRNQQNPVDLLGGTDGTETGAGSNRGRTLVARGPVTLYYTSNVVVHGNIVDREYFFTLWDEANFRNLRRAGYDIERSN